MTSVNSRSVARARNSAADSPRDGSILMSSGPSKRKEKPRAASSICGEEIPRSSSTPSTCASARAARTSGSSENHARRKTKRASSRASAAAEDSACGSRSTPTRRPPRAKSGEHGARMTAATVGRVDVDVPSGLTASAATASSSRTGTWPPSGIRAKSRRARAAARPRGTRSPARSAPASCASSQSSNFLTLSDQHGVLVEIRVAA